MIDIKRSKYKKTTEKYEKDGIFDIIDIQESLEKNKFIPKININEFLYKNHNFTNQNMINNSIDNLSLQETIQKINKNKFGIKIEDLILEYKNGYKIRLIDKYFPLDLLGEGAFSSVISAFDFKSKIKLAIKIIVKNDENFDVSNYLENETKIQFKVDHPNVVKLYEVLDNSEYMFMFMELMNGGTLKDVIVERYFNKEEYLFRDSECALIIKGIIQGLEYLHGMNIMHRDLKPENILFKNKNDLNSIKIADFGLAIIHQEKEKEKCGTLLYMTPEALLKKTYDNSVDIWACGLILFILSSGGRHPLYTQDMNYDSYIEVIKNEITWRFPASFPLYILYLILLRLARNLFMKMCKIENTNRFEAWKVMRHPWITRSPKSNIPETLVESYFKLNIINKFKHMLSSLFAIQVYKKFNFKNFSKIKNVNMTSNNNTSTSIGSKILNTNSSVDEYKENINNSTKNEHSHNLNKFLTPANKRKQLGKINVKSADMNDKTTRHPFSIPITKKFEFNFKKFSSNDNSPVISDSNSSCEDTTQNFNNQLKNQIRFKISKKVFPLYKIDGVCSPIDEKLDDSDSKPKFRLVKTKKSNLSKFMQLDKYHKGPGEGLHPKKGLLSSKSTKITSFISQGKFLSNRSKSCSKNDLIIK